MGAYASGGSKRGPVGRAYLSGPNPRQNLRRDGVVGDGKVVIVKSAGLALNKERPSRVRSRPDQDVFVGRVGASLGQGRERSFKISSQPPERRGLLRQKLGLQNTEARFASKRGRQVLRHTERHAQRLSWDVQPCDLKDRSLIIGTPYSS